jgi:hypothetical protein
VGIVASALLLLAGASLITGLRPTIAVCATESRFRAEGARNDHCAFPLEFPLAFCCLLIEWLWSNVPAAGISFRVRIDRHGNAPNMHSL